MTGSRTKGVGKSGGRLARRKEALERAAERVAEQRQAAAEAEAERLRREAAFDELVADFELAVEDEQAVVAAVEEEVRRVRERGRVRVAEARAVAARIVVAMGDAGESVAGCGRRLGVGVERVRELRRLGREATAGDETGAGAGKTAGGEETGPGASGDGVAQGAAVGGEQHGGVRGVGPAGAARAIVPPAAAPSAGAPSAGAPSAGAARVAAPPTAVPAAGAGAASAAESGAGASGSVGVAGSGWPESR
ncbi:hypothetical protein AB0A81_26380 [Streptomyces flaveolus]|uniref:Translation initiation factor IF-2 n=1 Tax=Streptomyces flaveolus TaxID=67297 RepID=A0ABV1VBA5_9ACTN